MRRLSPCWRCEVYLKQSGRERVVIIYEAEGYTIMLWGTVNLRIITRDSKLTVISKCTSCECFPDRHYTRMSEMGPFLDEQDRFGVRETVAWRLITHTTQATESELDKLHPQSVQADKSKKLTFHPSYGIQFPISIIHDSKHPRSPAIEAR